MDDLDLERILAETREESEPNFGEETEQLGEELPDSPDLDVTIDDLIFTLRQIATAVIDLKEKADEHEEMLVNLHASLSEILEEHHSHLIQVSSSLDDKIKSSQREIVQQVNQVSNQLKDQRNAVQQLTTGLARLATAHAASSSQLMKRLIEPDLEAPPIAESPEPPASKPTAVAVPVELPAAPAPAPSADTTETEDEEPTPEPPADPPAPADDADTDADDTDAKGSGDEAPRNRIEIDAIKRRAAADTAKQKARSDYRKVTFTARLRRKLTENADGEVSTTLVEAAPAPAPAPEKSTSSSSPRLKAIRRPTPAPIKTPEPAPEEAPDKADEKAADKPAEKAPDKAAEKVPDKVDEPDETKADEGPMNIGDVPVPALVKHCQKQVFNFKIKVSQIVHNGTLPRGGKLHEQVSKLLDACSNKMMKQSLDIHHRNQAIAQQKFLDLPASKGKDPALFWDEERLDEYRKFRTDWYVLEVLDKIEALIIKYNLEDHHSLVDELAMEMDIGRIDVKEGKTEYDSKRHRIKEGTQQPLGGDFYRAIISGIFKPGYVDLSTGHAIRKAIVRVKMVPR